MKSMVATACNSHLFLQKKEVQQWGLVINAALAQEVEIEIQVKKFSNILH